MEGPFAGHKRPCPFLFTRFGTRQYFDFIVIIKDGTINDNVVTTGRTLSKQSLSAIYSASSMDSAPGD